MKTSYKSVFVLSTHVGLREQQRLGLVGSEKSPSPGSQERPNPAPKFSYQTVWFNREKYFKRGKGQKREGKVTAGRETSDIGGLGIRSLGALGGVDPSLPHLGHPLRAAG